MDSTNKTIWAIPPEYGKVIDAMRDEAIRPIHECRETQHDGVWQKCYVFRTVRECNRVHYRAYGFYFGRDGRRKYQQPK